MATYVVVHNRIHDAQKSKEYYSKVGATLAPHRHQILVATEHSEVIEGDTPLHRTIVLKFDSRDAAMAWYRSPAYEEILPLRLEATEGYAVIVDGVQ